MKISHFFEKTQDIESHVNVIPIKSKVNFRLIVQNVPRQQKMGSFTISTPNHCIDKLRNKSKECVMAIVVNMY